MESLSALLAFSERNPTVTSGSPNKGSVMPSFDISFDFGPKRLNKQSSWIIWDAMTFMWRQL